MDASLRLVAPTDAGEVRRVIDAVDRGRPHPTGGETAGAQTFLDDPNGFIIAAYDGEAPVGLAWGAHLRYPSGRRMTYLHQLEVVPTHRDRGIGSALVAAASEAAVAADSARFWLSTGAHNEGAQRLYARLGGARKELGDVNYWWDLTATAGRT